MPDPGMAELLEKYREMHRLRREHEAGVVDETPKARLAALAARFPGALREIDELPMDLIEERIAALERIVEAGEDGPDWARISARYHGFMRAVLRIKRLCLGKSPEEALALVRGSYTPAPDEPPAERFGPAELAHIASPPEGRLNPWVFEQLARDLGRTPTEIRDLLFPRRSRSPG